jgi:hypothetical protein
MVIGDIKAEFWGTFEQLKGMMDLGKTFMSLFKTIIVDLIANIRTAYTNVKEK